MDENQKLELLKQCPAFKYRQVILNAEVARLFVEKPYKPGELIYSRGSRNHAFFFVVEGFVRLDGSEKRFCGPNCIFGEDAVVKAKEGALTNAVARTEVKLLALLPEHIDRAFALLSAPHHWQQALQNEHRLRLLGPQVLDVLRRMPEFGNVARQNLYHLLEGATVLDRIPPECAVLGHRLHGLLKRTALHSCPSSMDEQLFEESTTPKSYYVLLTGELKYTRAGELLAKSSDPTVVGATELIRGKVMSFNIATSGATTVVRLSEEALRQRLETDPALKRIRILSKGADSKRTERKQRVVRLVSDETLHEDRPDVALVLRGLTDLLAERLAAHLCNWVLVLHLEPPGSVGAETKRLQFKPTLPGYARVHPKPSANTGVGLESFDEPWVEHRYVPLAQQGTSSTTIELKLADHDSKADLILIDTSAVPKTSITVTLKNEDNQSLEHVRLMTRPSSEPMEESTEISTAIIGSRGLAEEIGFLFKEVLLQRNLRGTPRYKRLIRYSARWLSNTVPMAVVERLVEPRLEMNSPAWPLGAVRVCFSTELIDALSRASAKEPVTFEALQLVENVTAHLTIDRWARGVAKARIGLALGGGGTYGDVHLPLLKKLEAANIPIDLISGSSAGSSVGAYYAVFGLQQLDNLHLSRWMGVLPLALLSGSFMEMLLLAKLGGIRLHETEISFLAVVTDSDLGIESYVREGTYARAVRASSSLPPLASMVVGDRRYLDGGLTANVPVDVLREEGADFVIASNPISRVHARRWDPPLDIPILRQFPNPLRRITDFWRMFGMLVRTIGESQVVRADVVYRPDPGESGLFAFVDPRYREALEKTPTLNLVIAEFQLKFHELLRHPPALVQVNHELGRIEVRAPVVFEPGTTTLTKGSVKILDKVAEVLKSETQIEYLRLLVNASNSPLAAGRAKTILAHLKGWKIPQSCTADSRVSNDEDVLLEVMDNSQLNDALKEELNTERALRRSAERKAQVQILLGNAKQECLEGDPQLGRLLALEAARLEFDPDAGTVLRLAFERRGWSEQWQVSNHKAVTHVAYNPKRPYLAAGSADGLVYIWPLPIKENNKYECIDHRGTSDPGIRGVEWSPDGRLLASAGFDWMVRVHELDEQGSCTQVATFYADTWDHWGVAFSPQGDRLLVTAGKTNCLGVWDFSKRPGHAPVKLKHQFDIRQAAWHPDGTRVASGTKDGSVFVWDSTSGTMLEQLASGLLQVHGLVWSPDGRRLAVASTKGATVHTLQHPELTHVMEGHQGAVRHISWSRDEKSLLTVGSDGTARIWSARDYSFKMLMRGDDALRGAEWSPNSRWAVAWSKAYARVWNTRTGELLAELAGSFEQVRWNGTGNQLSLAASDGFIHQWEPTWSTQVAFRKHRQGIEVVLWHPDDSTLAASADASGTVFTWNPRDGKQRDTVLKGGGASARIAWRPRGKQLAVIRLGDSHPRIFEAGAPDASPSLELEPLPELELATNSEVPSQLSFSPDGSLLAFKCHDQLAVWDMDSSRVLYHQRERRNPIDSMKPLSWHPDSSQLALPRWRRGSAVEVIDIQQRQLLFTLDHHEDGVWSVTYSPDGKWIATASNDSYARIYDAKSGKLVYTCKHNAAVRAVAWRSQGDLLATGDDVSVARIWRLDPERGFSPVSQEEQYHGKSRCLSWSADGRFLASGGESGQVQIWSEGRDEQQGQWNISAILKGHRVGVRWVSFSPDGRELISADAQGVALVHPVDDERLLECVRAMRGRAELTPEEEAKYLSNKQP